MARPTTTRRHGHVDLTDGQSYTTHPGSRLLFPRTVPTHRSGHRARGRHRRNRRRSRADDAAPQTDPRPTPRQSIADQRRLNEPGGRPERIAERNKPPPF